MKNFYVLCITIAMLVGSAYQDASAMVLCDYTFTGSPGNYLLDFTFTNNIPAEYNQHLGQVALDLSFDINSGSPTGVYWIKPPIPVLNNFSQGGSNINYYNIWASAWLYDFPTGNTTPNFDIFPGNSLSGFTIHSNEIPEVIHFTAFANDVSYRNWDQEYYGGEGYYGNDAFLKGHYSAFEGIANGPQAVVPEPSSIFLIGSGLISIFYRLKKMC